MVDETRPQAADDTPPPEHETPRADENVLESPGDLLRTDPEAARESLTKRKRDRSHGDIQRPPRSDPRHTDFTVPPGQTDIPAGGTTGGGMGGGSSKRRTQE